VLGIPSISIGSRQFGRFSSNSIIEIPVSLKQLIHAFNLIDELKGTDKSNHFGDGKSATRFIKFISMDKLWKTPIQKKFIIDYTQSYLNSD
jgi:UDP-N-acetylglucosamine 2-epimerase (hydrolysing)